MQNQSWLLQCGLFRFWSRTLRCTSQAIIITVFIRNLVFGQVWYNDHFSPENCTKAWTKSRRQDRSFPHWTKAEEELSQRISRKKYKEVISLPTRAFYTEHAEFEKYGKYKKQISYVTWIDNRTTVMLWWYWAVEPVPNIRDVVQDIWFLPVYPHSIPAKWWSFGKCLQHAFCQWIQLDGFPPLHYAPESSRWYCLEFRPLIVTEKMDLLFENSLLCLPTVIPNQWSGIWDRASNTSQWDFPYL